MLVRTMVGMRTTMMMMMRTRRRIRPRCCQTLASPDSCQLRQALLCLRSPRIDISTFCLLVKILYAQCFHHLGWSSCAWGINLQFASSPPSSWRSSPPSSSPSSSLWPLLHHHQDQVDKGAALVSSSLPLLLLIKRHSHLLALSSLAHKLLPAGPCLSQILLKCSLLNP